MRLSNSLMLACFVAIPGSFAGADHLYGTLSGWGQMIDPDGDCSFQVSNARVTIGIGRRSHTLDIEQGHMNSPRIVETLTGDGSAEVTVRGGLRLPEQLAEGAAAYVSGGLLAMQDNRNYVRLERASFTRGDGVHHYMNFELRRNGRRVRMGRFADYPIGGEEDLRLRIEIRGEIVRGLVRRSEGDWHEMGTAQLGSGPARLVGIHALNTSGEPITVDFESLQRERDFAPATPLSSSHLAMEAAANRTAMGQTASKIPPAVIERMIALSDRIDRMTEMTDDEKDGVISECAQLVRDAPGPFRPALALDALRDVSRELEKIQEYDRSLLVCDLLAELLEESGNDEVSDQIQELRAQLEKRAGMIGKPFALEGDLFEGGSLDWNDYRGSLVLVDFWASWCGPCRREMPNVAAQYEKYKDRNFKVIGVCLDTDRYTAQAYIDETNMPWSSLFVDKVGWKHPMAQKYGVKSLPTAILVDRDGKVLSFAARGEHLQRLLHQRIGDRETNSDAMIEDIEK